MDILWSVAYKVCEQVTTCMKIIYQNATRHLNHAALLQHVSVCSPRMKGKTK